MNWHDYRFKIKLPSGQKPKWWIDICLIDTVVRDVLAQHGKQIELWRFHRRAKNDDSGHKFSFLCFCSDEISESIQKLVDEHSVPKCFLESSILEKLEKEEYGSRIEATSDGTWSIELKKAWPRYIMGVSALMLELISEIRSHHSLSVSTNNTADLEKIYSAVNKRLIGIWSSEGSHAFLHHINALFGYVPTKVIPRGNIDHGFVMSF